MATMLAHITVKSGTEELWEGICRRMYDASHGAEPGLLRYEYWRGAEPRTYYTLLSFEDHRAFVVHQTSDHHETASPNIRECMESFRLEFVDPIGGASPLPPTDHQSAPDGANELTREYTDRFAAQVADWWLALR
jgi:quinol monooxygenase YgiN